MVFALQVGQNRLLLLHGERVPCLVDKKYAEGEHEGTFRVRYPPNGVKPQTIRRYVKPKYLRMPVPRFPDSWADWLTSKLFLVGGRPRSGHAPRVPRIFPDLMDWLPVLVLRL